MTRLHQAGPGSVPNTLLCLATVRITQKHTEGLEGSHSNQVIKQTQFIKVHYKLFCTLTIDKEDNKVPCSLPRAVSISP